MNPDDRVVGIHADWNQPEEQLPEPRNWRDLGINVGFYPCEWQLMCFCPCPRHWFIHVGPFTMLVSLP